jgi:hypothetical protein
MLLGAQTAAFSVEKHSNQKKHPPISRRDIFQSSLSTASILMLFPAITHATEEQKATIWLSGKPPQVPGKKPAESTRKDGSFLRSIADCKNQCLNSGEKTKEDCLSECQDICCTTYEQCTFAIVPRI